MSNALLDNFHCANKRRWNLHAASGADQTLNQKIVCNILIFIEYFHGNRKSYSDLYSFEIVLSTASTFWDSTVASCHAS